MKDKTPDAEKNWLTNLAEFVGESAGIISNVVTEIYTDSTVAAEEAFEALKTKYNEVSAGKQKCDIQEEKAQSQHKPEDAPKTCMWSACKFACAPDYDLCYDHLYQRQAEDRSAWLRQSANATKNQTKADWCKWKNCLEKRVENGEFCRTHERENDQFKARQCGNKRRHVSLEEAQAHAARLSLRGDDVTAYRCRVCPYFHTGHSNL